jgi:hypothetical protein
MGDEAGGDVTPADFSPQSTDTASSSEKPFEGLASKALLAVGLSVMAFGVVGLFHSANRTHPGQWIRWLLGALLAHDIIVAPLVFGVAALVVSRIPPPWRAPVQGGLVASGMVILVAFPFVRGYGRTPENTSILPNNYAWGLLITLAVIWAAVGIALMNRKRRPA